MLAILNSFKTLIKAIDSLTAFHWALIVNYLIKPSEKLTQEERKELSVDPSLGTSGMTMDEVAEIRDMWRKHPLVERILEFIPNTVV